MAALRPFRLVVLASISLLAACTTKDGVIPQDGPDMATIYEQHMAKLAADRAVRVHAPPRPLTDPDYAGYTVSVYNELSARFGRLPNPDLVMYVFPHRAEGAPVPDAYVVSVVDDVVVPLLRP